MGKKTKNFAADKDFTEDMLPNNRKTQFFMILKNRMPLLLKASLLTFVFFIPLLLAMSTKTVFVYNFYRQYAAERIDHQTLQGYLSYTNMLAAVAYVPCLMIASLGLGGLNRLTHQLVFGEGILFKADYFLGIKNNWKQYLLYTFLFSMLYVLGRCMLFYFQENVVSVVIFFIGCVISVPYFLVLLLYSSVYTSKGGELIRNVFYATLKGKWRMLGYVLSAVVPMLVISLLTYGYLFLILSALFILLIPALSLLGHSVFAGVFDTLFNCLNNVEVVKKGLYIAEKEKEIITQTHLRLVKEFKEKGEAEK